jgi:putative CocE/NonD family hydrolase
MSLLVAILALPALVLPLPAEPPASAPFDFRSAYLKQEAGITMRDGVELFTVIYRPKDSSRPHPILITRTPYGVGPYGGTNYLTPSNNLLACALEGFILVYQDVRGRHHSGGQFVNVRPIQSHPAGSTNADENTDARDTIDWLLTNVPGHNGRVGLTGVSYPGFYAAQAMINTHPAIQCVLPQAPVCDWFLGDDVHENGALFLRHTFTSLPIFEPPPATNEPPFTPSITNAYEFYLALGPLANINRLHYHDRIPFWNQILAHETYDRFWQERALQRQLRNVRTAVLAVGGWDDDEDLPGTLKTYHTVAERNPNASSGLVLGPWRHGGWSRHRPGASELSLATAQYYREHIEMPYLRRHLLGQTNLNTASVIAFETGRNRWNSFSSWPPPESRKSRLYFHSGKHLRAEPAASATDSSFDEYLSNPANPVPETNTLSRPDVLAYETSELTEDLTIAGPVRAHLEVSTTGTDSDWVVRILDLGPPTNANSRGEVTLVRAGIFRGKFRDSFEHPHPFVPGKITRVEWPLNDILHTFQRGHRLRVEIQSSWFPMFDLNPQTFCSIGTARPEDFRPATQRLHHTPRHASWLEFLTLN